MRHNYFGKKLSRTKNERRNLFRNLLRSLIEHGRITTTLAKAKAVQPLAETLVTKAKAGGEQKKREVFSILTDKDTVAILWSQASTRFSTRASGFTRIIKLGNRVGDAAERVVLEFVDQVRAVEKSVETKGKNVVDAKEIVAPQTKRPVTTKEKKQKKANK